MTAGNRLWVRKHLKKYLARAKKRARSNKHYRGDPLPVVRAKGVVL